MSFEELVQVLTEMKKYPDIQLWRVLIANPKGVVLHNQVSWYDIHVNVLHDDGGTYPLYFDSRDDWTTYKNSRHQHPQP